MSLKKRAQIAAKVLIQEAEEGEFKHYTKAKEAFLHHFFDYRTHAKLPSDREVAHQFINQVAGLCQMAHDQHEAKRHPRDGVSARQYEHRKRHFLNEARREYDRLW